MDPELHAWVVKQLKGTNASTSPREVARILLDAHRRDKIYVPDPTDGEFIVSPECLFGTCGGIKFDGGDCDDLSAGYASAVLSAGAPGAAIVGQYIDDSLAHVLVAVFDGTRWWYADPSEPGLAFGAAGAATNEIWVDVMSGSILCKGACKGVPPPPPPTMRGDFVGVAGSRDGAAICTVQESSSAAGVVVGALVGASVGVLLGWLIWRRG